MSSMLRKAATGSFKPRAPVARRRHPGSVASSVAPSESAQSSATPAQGSTPDPSQDVATSSNTAESRPDQPAPPNTSNANQQPTPGPSQLLSTISERTASPEDLDTRRTSLTPSASSVAKPKQSTPRPPPSPKPAAQQAQGPVEATASVAESTTPSAITSRANASNKVPTGRSKPVQPKAITKPRPSPEIAEPGPSRATAQPTPIDDEEDVIPSIENGEASSKAATPSKAKGNAVAKPRKPAAPKKRKAAPATGEDEAEAGAEAAGPPKKKRAPCKAVTKKKASTKIAEAEGATNGESVASKRRSQRKTAVSAEKRGPEEAVETNDQEQHSGSETPDEEAAKTTRKSRKTRVRKRAVTPEDSENLTIDPATMTLAELTKDIKIGQRWDKAELIEEAEREKKRERAERVARLKLDAEQEAQAEAAGTPAAADRRPPTPPAEMPEEVQMRLVNGEIVIDESTTRYNRHAAADRAREGFEEKEEHDFSRHVTQATHMTNKNSSAHWTADETEHFYHGLRMFGTDFNMIAKMFGGGKTRRQIKLKFNREERRDPAGINSCLVGEKSVAMDIDAVGGGDGLEETADIEAELKREFDAREAQIKLIEDEVAAEAARKREELMGKRGKRNGPGDEEEMEVVDEDAPGADGDAASAAPSRSRKGKEPEAHPYASYGVGTDPDVIDETDLPDASSARGRGRSRGRGGRGGRGRGRSRVFAGGIGAD